MRRLLLFTLALCAGCATQRPTCDANCVAQTVEQRTSLKLADSSPVDQVMVPTDLAERILTEDEAAYLALLNNALFRELLTELQLTRADIVQAGLLPNPEVVYLFNVPDKPFKYLVEIPLEAFWLRPVRLRIAEQENDRIAQRLVQGALDLIRDARQAYLDVQLAKERLRIGEELVKLRSRILELAEIRLREGDANGQEVATAKIDALLAKQDIIRLSRDVLFFEERLRNLLALGELRHPLNLTPLATENSFDGSIESLVAEAVENRPDIQSADHSILASQERLHFAKKGWVRVLGILDATSGRATGHEFGPAFRITLPIFNQNQGLIARAEGELERAIRQRRTIHDRIVQEVRQAHIRYEQARIELASLRTNVQPEVNAAIKRAEASYKEGNSGYLIVLETSRRLIDVMIREAQLRVDQRRAWVELERSVGRHLSPDMVPSR